MSDSKEKPKKLEINQETIDVLVANVIPTSKYFEIRFDHLQHQLDDFRNNVDEKFRNVDKRFEQTENQINEFKSDVNKRFEQVDKRFEQVDKHFIRIEEKLDSIIERIDVKIDSGLRENRALTVRLFTFAMVFTAISMATLFAKIIGLI
jgi:predicted transcriptional regulator